MAEALRRRSRNYRNVFDTKMNFVRPRGDDGNGWNAVRSAWHGSFQANGAISPNPIRGRPPSSISMICMLTWVCSVVRTFSRRKLDELFNTSPKLPPDAPPDIAGMVGQYAHGNEPSHHVAYLYAYTGAHYKTQAARAHVDGNDVSAGSRRSGR
jgi:putative alpha-1,2-mannosidase